MLSADALREIERAAAHRWPAVFAALVRLGLCRPAERVEHQTPGAGKYRTRTSVGYDYGPVDPPPALKVTPEEHAAHLEALRALAQAGEPGEPGEPGGR